METGVWLLMGFTGSTEGVLELKDSMISFTAFDQGALTDGQLRNLAQSLGNESIFNQLNSTKPVILFNSPIHLVEKIVFPWYTFGGGMNLTIKSNKSDSYRIRFSFLQPQNTVRGSAGREMSQIAGNLSEGRKLGRQWYEALKNRVV